VCSFNQITLHSSRLEVLKLSLTACLLTLAAAQLKIMNAISANALLEETVEKDFDSHPAGCSNLHYCLHSYPALAADTLTEPKFLVPTVPLVMGGRNVVAAANLKKDALEKYNMNPRGHC